MPLPLYETSNHSSLVLMRPQLSSTRTATPETQCAGVGLGGGGGVLQEFGGFYRFWGSRVWKFGGVS